MEEGSQTLQGIVFASGPEVGLDILILFPKSLLLVLSGNDL